MYIMYQVSKLHLRGRASGVPPPLPKNTYTYDYFSPTAAVKQPNLRGRSEKKTSKPPFRRGRSSTDALPPYLILYLVRTLDHVNFVLDSSNVAY